MSLKLPDTVSSPQDLGSLIVEIHDSIRWLTHEGIKKKAGDNVTPAPPNMSPAAASLIHEWGASLQKLEALIKELEIIQRKGRVITITLAAEPSSNLKQVLVSWCRKELASDVLVAFTFNRAILGGLIVRAGSRVFDWSFRRQILRAGDKFPEVLSRV